MSTLVTRAGESAVTRAIFLFESLLIGAALMVFLRAAFGLRIMLTDSAAPVGIYRVEPLPSQESVRDLRRGELVEACLPDAIAQRGLERGYLQPWRLSWWRGAGCQAHRSAVGRHHCHQCWIRRG